MILFSENTGIPGKNVYKERVSNLNFGVVLSQTIDNFLGGRIKLVQPIDGYRAGIDPIFLAASIHSKPNDKVLDVGSGVGVASISLAVRCPDLRVYGLEIQDDLVTHSHTNLKSNNVEDRIDMINGDLLSPPSLLKPHSFDQVMTNPPYYEHTRGHSSPIPSKAQANTETVDMGKWIKASLTFLKPKGIFTMIHRAERISEILHHLQKHTGCIVVYPLWPGSNKPARRVIVQARKNVGGELRLAPGMVLHSGNEKYSPDAEAILRHAQALIL